LQRCSQARSLVLKIQRGQNSFLEGDIFVFVICFHKMFSGHNKIWGVQKLWELPRMSLRGMGLGVAENTPYMIKPNTALKDCFTRMLYTNISLYKDNRTHKG